MKISVKGIVQGVGFRPTVYRVAKSLGINGYVLNKGSNVEIFVDKKVDQFLEELRREISGNASIDEIELKEEEGEYEDFVILKSAKGAKSSLLPPDTATCDNCLSEIFDSTNRRHLYAFTNCTYCGARFSLIKDVPYDRDKTSMDDFQMCSNCKEEYRDPLNVRFHAQTTSCKDCGPRYTLYDKNRRVIYGDHIKIFAEYIDGGSIGIMKSWGGMHLICNLREIKRFREWYGREAKPFAVMFRDMDAVREYMDVTDAEGEEISSTRRPIVLVTKKKDKLYVLEGVSPGLGNAGVYIPYTGLHHIFFKYLKEDAVIMTSANIPGEPMIIKDEDAFSLNADIYLLHNRDIINRIDDTVIRLYNDRRFFLRRSRGFVPDKIGINHERTVISVGAEENVNSAISIGGNIYITQHIGNTKYYPTTEFLRDSTERLLGLLGAQKIDGIGVDLHPRYLTRRYGRELAKRFDVEVIEVQHHFAHAASLMVDNQVEEDIIALTLDGAGYGTDGSIWGGEILLSSFEGFKRIGHLEKIPLIGGDAATKDPRRLLFAISEKLGEESNLFEEDEAEILRNLMKRSPVTSSTGRVLDALSCYLGIGIKRSYDGEPAMRLEKYLDAGELRYDFEAENDSETIRTLPLFDQLREYPFESERDKADLAYSFVYKILEEMTKIAIINAEENDIRYIGITGGVSYNIPIVRMVDNFVKEAGLKFLTHNQVPNGDGGISTGQNAVAGCRLK